MLNLSFKIATTLVHTKFQTIEDTIKGGPSQFLGENAHTQNPFFEDFDPISGFYIYSHIDFHSKYNSKCQN
jgi:hypothetical protein